MHICDVVSVTIQDIVYIGRRKVIHAGFFVFVFSFVT